MQKTTHFASRAETSDVSSSRRICTFVAALACRKNENWESKLSFQAEEFLKEREHRDSEVKSWEKEKKRWKVFKTEPETEVCVSA